MVSLFKFNRRYFSIGVLLLVIEVLIALFVHDQIIRPYVGDVLVVIMIYCWVKAFFAAPVFTTAMAVLAFSFVVEGLQYLHIVNRLGLQHSRFAKTVIGTSFAWTDLLAYIIGIAVVLLAEYRKSRALRNL